MDDFLIEKNSLKRTFHQAKKYADNPIMKPETTLEHEGDMPAVTPKGGGVWWDPKSQCYKMWYDAAWCQRFAYATSRDGIVWNRPQLEFTKGTNHILPGFHTNSSTAFIDFDEASPAKRYKLFLRQSDRDESSHQTGWDITQGRLQAYVFYSADGIHWSEPTVTSPVGDRSTMFYNPFRGKWIYSIRSYSFKGGMKRVRAYHECDDLFLGASWEKDEEVFWTRIDKLDIEDPQIKDTPHLYNLDAVAYESVMLGLFEVLLGPHNNVCAQGGIPKTTDITLGFSRDGFHWHRPDRRAFIDSSREKGAWDRGYVQSVGGCCLVYKDEIRFYYTGFKGDERKKGEKETMDNGMYANASTGFATLRRDGFASLDAGEKTGVVTTRPIVFSGEHLFVNVNVPNGMLKAEVLYENENVIDGFSKTECIPVVVDSCKVLLKWKHRASLKNLKGKPVRFRFHLTNGQFYSFWVSKKTTGESNGYLGACSPDYKSFKDVDNKL